MGATGSGAPAEWDAQTYHRVSDPHVVWGGPVLDRLPLRGDETVMDAGCGTGRVTAQLLERVPAGHVIAVDRSAAMLEEAEAFLRPRFGERVSFIQADLVDLDRMLTAPVDRIFSTATFHWIADHDALFAALFASLVPGGWLVAQCGGGPNIARFREHVATVAAREPFAPHLAGWPGPWHFASAEATAERLAKAGFREIETVVIAAPVTQPDRAAYAEFIRSVVLGEHLARLPTEDLKGEFVDALTDLAAQDDPPFTLDYWRLNIRAQRPAE